MDSCAHLYECNNVTEHPDVVAFKGFEEKILDKILFHLAKEQNRPIRLIDIGCGTGRLHLRYGQQVHIPKLRNVFGIDFSKKMLDLAIEKIKKAGINKIATPALSFKQGSAFDFEAEPINSIQVAVNLNNTIGTMQGQKGAVKLFQTLNRFVENTKGIAIISCYMKKYIETYALPQYESSLYICGQPIWLKPDTYSTNKYKQLSIQYKKAYSNDPFLKVDVYDIQGNLIKKNHVLKRDPDLVKQTIESGVIRTFSNYKSHWYSFQMIDNLIKIFWDSKSYHVQAKELDPKNAEQGQLAILDYGNHLQNFFETLSN